MAASYPGFLRSGERSGPAAPRTPVLVSHQHGSGDGNGGVGADQDADDEGEGEAAQHLAAEEEEGEDGEKGEAGSQHGPAQGLIDAAIDQIGQRFTAAEAQILADAVEDDDGVVHRVADQW